MSAAFQSYRFFFLTEKSELSLETWARAIALSLCKGWIQLNRTREGQMQGHEYVYEDIGACSPLSTVTTVTLSAHAQHFLTGLPRKQLRGHLEEHGQECSLQHIVANN